VPVSLILIRVSYPNIKDDEVGGTCSTHGEERSDYRVLVGRPEGKRPLGKPRCRWEDNIKLDSKEIGIDEANWIQLAQDRVHWAGFCEHVEEPSDSIRKQDIF
jgi:hypothetical protein